MQNKNVTEFIENTIDEQKEILVALRNIIIKTVPDSKEQFKWNRPVYATEKDYCYLTTAKKYVTLGFFNFEKVTDEENLLEGTGAKMRHIKIDKIGQINSELLAKMLREAAEF